MKTMDKKTQLTGYRRYHPGTKPDYNGAATMIERVLADWREAISRGTGS